MITSAHISVEDPLSLIRELGRGAHISLEDPLSELGRGALLAKVDIKKAYRKFQSSLQIGSFWACSGDLRLWVDCPRIVHYLDIWMIF